MIVLRETAHVAVTSREFQFVGRPVGSKQCAPALSMEQSSVASMFPALNATGAPPAREYVSATSSRAKLSLQDFPASMLQLTLPSTAIVIGPAELFLAVNSYVVVSA